MEDDALNFFGSMFEKIPRQFVVNQFHEESDDEDNQQVNNKKLKPKKLGNKNMSMVDLKNKAQQHISDIHQANRDKS